MNSAPQVSDGKVFVSTSGQPTGGEAIALDQESGKVLWRLDETKLKKDRTVGGAAGTGGAWNAAAIGADGTVFYGIGNPYRSDEQAIKQPTRLLYNDSTIAVDPETGKVKWYMQGVPNDIYDWDMQISPIVVEEEGQNIVLDGGKMGYVYAMEEATGKLLWKTPVGKHNGHDEDSARALEGKFHPTYPYRVYPGGLGGIETNMAVSDGVVYAPIVNAWQEKNEPKDIFGDNSQELSTATGAMAAVEIKTGKVLWETELPQIALGAATVSNDLVFTVLYDGTVVALNRETGKVAWEGKLPGPSNSPMLIEGKTLIAINSIPTKGKPQIVAWELGATGKVQAEAPGASQKQAGSEGAEEAGGEVNITVGKTAFSTNCASCHTLSEAGTTGTVGPNLDQLKPSKSVVEKQVTQGGGGMPAFKGTLSKTEIESVAEYVAKAAGTGNDSLGGKSTAGGGGV
jgi:outer membrane protein assembly factor BamB